MSQEFVATVQEEDIQRLEELLITRKFHDYNLILPNESDLIVPYHRKLHLLKDGSGFLLEIFSETTPDWQQEEKDMGPTRHCYSRPINPGQQAAGVAGHYHRKKQERVIITQGAVIYLIQPVIEDENSKPQLTSPLEAILLHSDFNKLEIMDENERAKVLKLPIIGIPPYLAHRLFNPLDNTRADVTVLTQKGFDPKDPDTYSISMV